jgi:hypothetical protein
MTEKEGGLIPTVVDSEYSAGFLPLELWRSEIATQSFKKSRPIIGCKIQNKQFNLLGDPKPSARVTG